MSRLLLEAACPECDGAGRVRSGSQFNDCEKCDGTGIVLEQVPDEETP